MCAPWRRDRSRGPAPGVEPRSGSPEAGLTQLPLTVSQNPEGCSPGEKVRARAAVRAIGPRKHGDKNRDLPRAASTPSRRVYTVPPRLRRPAARGGRGCPQLAAAGTLRNVTIFYPHFFSPKMQNQLFRLQYNNDN